MFVSLKKFLLEEGGIVGVINSEKASVVKKTVAKIIAIRAFIQTYSSF